jgi:hypothetical protein
VVLCFRWDSRLDRMYKVVNFVLIKCYWPDLRAVTFKMGVDQNSRH